MYFDKHIKNIRTSIDLATVLQNRRWSEAKNRRSLRKDFKECEDFNWTIWSYIYFYNYDTNIVSMLKMRSHSFVGEGIQSDPDYETWRISFLKEFSQVFCWLEWPLKRSQGYFWLRIDQQSIFLWGRSNWHWWISPLKPWQCLCVPTSRLNIFQNEVRERFDRYP